jgi:predicted DNA-binding WGR domain protein
MAGPRPKPVLPDIPKKANVIKGDLVAKKDLTFQGVQYVQGNVIVGGVLQERHSNDVLIATGSIKAKAIKSGATLYAGETIEAEVIYVELGGNDTRLGAVGGISADLFILEDVEDAIYEGKVTAKEKITLSLASTGPLRKLKKLLAPHAFGLTDEQTDIDDDSLFDYSFLMGAISRGKPWRASDAPKPAKEPKREPKPAKKNSLLRWSRYLERRTRTAHEFCEVTVETKGSDATLTKRQGKVGTPGKATTKSGRVPISISLAGEDLVKKLKKDGYREIAKPTH